MITRDLDLDAINEETVKFRDELSRIVVGQSPTLQQITQIYQIINAGIANGIKPIGVFMLMGPTGTGKTHTVEAFAKIAMGDERKFIKINCAEMKLKHSVNKVLGAPAGYIGHKTKTVVNAGAIKEVTHPKKNFWILLLDEIEKAHQAFYQILLEVFDKAQLRDGKNRIIDYSRCIIFMTSNLGVAPIKKIEGFSSGTKDKSVNKQDAKKLAGDQQYNEALEKRFSPEFLNRIDYFSVYHKLSTRELRTIVGLEVQKIENRINKAKNTSISIKCTDSVLDQLIEIGNNPEFGARPIKRVLEKKIIEPFSLFLTTNQIKGDDKIYIDCVNDISLPFIFKATSFENIDP